MTTKVTYIACDGEEFETAEECLAYEKAMDPSDSLVMLDDDYCIIEGYDPASMYEHAMYLYIVDDKKVVSFFNWIEINTGYIIPEMYKTGDLLYYDNLSNNYVNLNKEIDHLVEKRNKSMDHICIKLKKERKVENGNNR